jgi:site-specific recombinase XerD
VLIAQGVDIATVASMAIHSSINTTARYDRRGDDAKKLAARTLHVGYAAAKPRADKRAAGRI